MTKPTPAPNDDEQPPSSQSTPHNSPEKKRQKKQNEKTTNIQPTHPTKLFAEITTTPTNTTPLWQTLRRLHPFSGHPYQPTQLFSESGKSLHNDATKATNLLAKSTRSDATKTRASNPTIKQWELLFNNAAKNSSPLPRKDSQFLTIMMMNLSTTPPQPIFQSFATPSGNLHSTIITSIWRAAHNLCGSNHTTTPKPNNTTKPQPSETTKPIQKTTKTATEKDSTQPTTPRNPYKQSTLPSTPRTTNQNSQKVPSRRNRERFDMKLFIDPSEPNPIKGFTARAKQWFEQLKSHDPSLIILPWYHNANNQPLLAPNTIPTTMKQLRHYFNRLSPKSGMVWTKVHLSMDQDPKEIASGPNTQLGWWYKDHDEGLYLRPLRDAESTQDLGILAYTSNFTNIPHTMELINASLSEMGCKFTIGGKLRPIKALKIDDQARNDHRLKGGTWQNQYWFALHLMSDSTHQRTAIRSLYKLFNQKNVPQPGGLRARFIPHEGVITMSSQTTGKRFKMLKKHRAVIQSLQIIRTDSIITLDEPNQHSNYTLRHYLTSLRHSTTNRPLYHSVDFSTSYMDEGSNTVILTAHHEHSDEATALASVLPALCTQKLHQSTSDWFTSASLEYCEGVIFDSETNQFQSQEDALFEDMLDEDFGQEVSMQFEGIPSPNSQQNEETSPQTDDSSFISFGTLMDAKKSPSPNITTATSTSSPSNLTDSITEDHTESLAASNAENELLRQQIQQLLIEKQQWTNNAQNPSTPPSTPPPNPNDSSPSTPNPPSTAAGARSKISSEDPG